MRCDRSFPFARRAFAVALGLVLGGLPATAIAQIGYPAGPRTYSLTDQEKADLIANGSEDKVDASLLRAQQGGDGKIHGEIGMTVGTRNTRGIYGNAVIPLGHGATVALAFDHYQSDPGKFHWRRGGWYWPEPNAPY